MQSRLGYKMGGIYSAADPHGPLAIPPGVIFPLTQAGLQRTPPESPRTQKTVVDLRRIRNKYAVEPWTYLPWKEILVCWLLAN